MDYKKQCGTFLKLNKEILDKFLAENDIGTGRVIFTKKLVDENIYGEEEVYYKVITIGTNGDLYKYLSENETSKVWYKQII